MTDSKTAVAQSTSLPLNKSKRRSVLRRLLKKAVRRQLELAYGVQLPVSRPIIRKGRPSRGPTVAYNSHIRCAYV